MTDIMIFSTKIARNIHDHIHLNNRDNFILAQRNTLDSHKEHF